MYKFLKPKKCSRNVSNSKTKLISKIIYIEKLSIKHTLMLIQCCSFSPIRYLLIGNFVVKIMAHMKWGLGSTEYIVCKDCYFLIDLTVSINNDIKILVLLNKSYLTENVHIFFSFFQLFYINLQIKSITFSFRDILKTKIYYKYNKNESIFFFKKYRKI